MKSIYQKYLSFANDGVGSAIKFRAEEYIKKLFEEFPDYNPREIAEVITTTVFLGASKRIIELRMEGKLKRNSK